MFAVAILATVSSLCVLSRSQRLSFSCACVVWPHWFLESFLFGDGRRWLSQTQKKNSWVPGPIREERVLADAITIDGRKEWICKFCSETNVWTRWRLQALWEQHPHGSARQTQAGDVREEWRMVFWFVFLEWRRSMENSGSSRRDQEAAATN